MYKTINKSQFMYRFKSMGREDQFSYEGLKALFEYLEQYAEYDNIAEFKNDYTLEDVATIEDLHDYTIVIPIDEAKGNFIIQQF